MSSQANSSSEAEWKAESGLPNVAHGAGGSSEGAKPSSKEAPLPEYEAAHKDVAGGQGTGGKGWTGSGKGGADEGSEADKKQ
ncbi:hypothetical protein V495_06381 [Pseudogymnoascus sp. VKM F-4514 (FW-929)]|nr:hypothetical protein V495_06381 [Pseudogymnoascus sp. VKM F-4514 (FW-929)]KFY54588.1 hypothetical protein V497_07580 [Pseudogymnoascus sp. VKM F-4516 (FW-969)]